MPRIRSAGFTLIEVLVALAVIALGLTAVIKALSEYTETANYTRQKNLASWIAITTRTSSSPAKNGAVRSNSPKRQWRICGASTSR